MCRVDRFAPPAALFAVFSSVEVATVIATVIYEMPKNIAPAGLVTDDLPATTGLKCLVYKKCESRLEKSYFISLGEKNYFIIVFPRAPAVISHAL